MTTTVPGGSAYSVLIVDECPVLRHGFHHILSQQFRCEVIEESCACDAMEFVAKRRWSAVIVGVPIPDGGLQLVSAIKGAAALTRVVFLSGQPEPEYATKALDAGALGYFTKQDSIPELIEGLKRVFAGKRHVSSCGKKSGLSSSGIRGLPHELLSKREYDVFLAIVSGTRLSRVAKDLEVNPKTVSTYRRRILEKMQATSNADLVGYAFKYVTPAGTGTTE